MPTINTFSYVASHGQNPRGRGSWAFQPGDGAGRIYEDVAPIWSPVMTYTEACRWARKNHGGWSELNVLP